MLLQESGDESKKDKVSRKQGFSDRELCFLPAV